METRDDSGIKEKKSGWDITPKGDESAMWTFISATGLFVLTGWCLSIGLSMGMLGLKFITSPLELPGWINAIGAGIFLIMGIVLVYFSMRLFIRAAHTAWFAFRKAWFLYSIRKYPDPDRALRLAEGDPVLEPYLRFLVRRGLVDFTIPADKVF